MVTTSRRSLTLSRTIESGNDAQGREGRKGRELKEEPPRSLSGGSNSRSLFNFLLMRTVKGSDTALPDQACFIQHTHTSSTVYTATAGCMQQRTDRSCSRRSSASSYISSCESSPDGHDTFQIIMTSQIFDFTCSSWGQKLSLTIPRLFHSPIKCVLAFRLKI